MRPHPKEVPPRPWLLGLVAFLVAFNLRPALTSVGPLLTEIASNTGIGAFGAAWLTTVPVLCLGIGGGLAHAIMPRLGLDRGILAGIATLALGLALRALAQPAWLYAGTILAGLGIGIAGVFLPALFKRDFPQRAGAMTGLYTAILCLGAALGTALSVPLREGIAGDWATALAAWVVPALLAALAWLPLAKRPLDARGTPVAPVPRLRGEPLAWQVTGFMGLQSALAYIQFGWLPALLAGRGYGTAEAGYLAALAMLGQAPGALIAGYWAGRRRDQRVWIACTLGAMLASFTALGFAPSGLMIPAALLLGTAGGASLALGLILIVLRTRDAREAGALSAMAQGIGYALAALGPLGFGLVHEATGSWRWPMALFAALACGALLCGLGAGRDRTIRAR